MKISFEADVLKQLLVEAGIDSNDAKAIVYDLMLLSNDVPRKLAPVQPVEPVVTAPTFPKPDRTIINKEPAPLPAPEYTQAPATPVETNRSRVRTHKRISFDSFGGQSTPLRED